MLLSLALSKMPGPTSSLNKVNKRMNKCGTLGLALYKSTWFETKFHIYKVAALKTSSTAYNCQTMSSVKNRQHSFNLALPRVFSRSSPAWNLLHSPSLQGNLLTMISLALVSEECKSPSKELLTTCFRQVLKLIFSAILALYALQGRESFYFEKSEANLMKAYFYFNRPTIPSQTY
uniref:Uncharacterized protein n=1 Tax=Molossus molossus TaxID=27622 RepID=A0A7J8C8T8_MOLMO|nr:hypothetical protein HJG59_009934 [Molossus molossus]